MRMKLFVAAFLLPSVFRLYAPCVMRKQSEYLELKNKTKKSHREWETIDVYQQLDTGHQIASSPGAFTKKVSSFFLFLWYAAH